MKNRTGVGLVFTVIALILYAAMHIYFAYLAFSLYQVWFGLLVVLLPVGGDILFAGASIAEGNWLPTIIFGVVGVVWYLAQWMSGER